MDFLNNAIILMESYATIIPLEIFVILGSLIEEIVAPIPSPFIMTLSGTLAKAQNHSVSFLFLLAFLGAVGKTIGAFILYLIANKAEDLILVKFGKFFGVRHKDIENIGKKLHNGWKDYVFLITARALPIIPSAPVSVVCGLIKLDKKTYLISTLLGTSVRNLLFLYIGYVGVSSYENIIGGLNSIESLIQIGIGIILIFIVALAYYKRRKSTMKTDTEFK